MENIIVDFMKHIELVVFVCLFFAFFGCTEDARDLQKQKSLQEELRPKIYNLNASHDIIDSPLPEGKCIGMMCPTKTPPWPFKLFFDQSLKGVQCSFEEIPEINKEFIEKNHILFFMYGAGDSFYSFSKANTYCKNSMKLSVKWLKATENGYPIPDKKRAECMLEKEVIPVYILYSNPKNIDVKRAAEIAKALNGAGPLIIVSDAELNLTNDKAKDKELIEKIKEQIIALKKNCPNCLIALGVKLDGETEYENGQIKLDAKNEYKIIQRLFDKNDISFTEFNKSVDLIAYGMNSHYFKTCESSKIMYTANEYSDFVLKNYQKPSLILYALFDKAKSADESCEWTKTAVGNAYSELSLLPKFVSNGIIGVSLYSFYGIGGALGPENCVDCAFMESKEIGDTCDYNIIWTPKTEPFFSNYMGFCQAYYEGLGKMSGITPLIFSTGWKNCEVYNPNIGGNILSTDTETTLLRPDEIKKQIINPSSPFFSCSGCIGKNITKMPESIKENSGEKEICSKFNPLLETEADRFDMDAVILRAAVWQESNFDPCAVSYVPKDKTGCNNEQIYSFTNPDRCCANVFTEYYVDKEDLEHPVTPCKPDSFFVNAPEKKGDKCKPCAYGIAQAIDYPLEVYNKMKITIPEVVRVCTKKDDFNPLRPADSACAYAYQYMYEKLPEAKKLTEEFVTLNTITDGQKEWYTTFFALNMMYGYSGQENWRQENWIENFNSQKDKTSQECKDDKGKTKPCCGIRDFFKYAEDCVDGYKTLPYAHQVLGKYKWLAKNCDECDTGKSADVNILEYLCGVNSEKKVYIDETCCNSLKSSGSYSAELMCTNPQCEEYCPKEK